MNIHNHNSKKAYALRKSILGEGVFFKSGKFRMQRVDFFISTINGKPDQVAKVLLI